GPGRALRAQAAAGCVVGQIECARSESRPQRCQRPSGSRSSSTATRRTRPKVVGVDALRLPNRLASKLPGKLGERAERPGVSLLRLHGVIAAISGPLPRSVINAGAVEKTLERAFAPDGLAAVALLVNSPGGSPTQSALVADRVRGLAAEAEVPVLAFCEDVAASGGYWLACAADEIYAHPTSLVGSIGVISQGFGLDGLIERFGVQRRLYTAGTSKSRLRPLPPGKPGGRPGAGGPEGEGARM